MTIKPALTSNYVINDYKTYAINDYKTCTNYDKNDCKTLIK